MLEAAEPRWGNPGGNTELFERVSSGKFKLLRPFR
jgi:hypothetical protein